MAGQAAGVMAVGAALQAVKENEKPRRTRVAGKVDVDEIAVGRAPALAGQRDGRRRAQRRIDGLEMPAGQPPGR
jgi:hypothetical protein